jgi:hypothetical protein
LDVHEFGKKSDDILSLNGSDISCVVPKAIKRGFAY